MMSRFSVKDVIVLASVWIAQILSVAEAVPNPIQIAGELIGSGFHRTLGYSITCDDMKYNNCEFYVEQNFSSSIMLYHHILDDMKHARQNTGYFPSVNVDAPKEHAKPFLAFLHGKCDKYSSVKFPIQIRYHGPGNMKFHNIHIAQPRVHMKCHGNTVHATDSISRPDYYCFNGKNFVRNDALSTVDKCYWSHIENVQHGYSLEAITFPIGDCSIFPAVLSATLALNWIGGIYVFYVSNKFCS